MTLLTRDELSEDFKTMIKSMTPGWYMRVNKGVLYAKTKTEVIDYIVSETGYSKQTITVKLSDKAITRGNEYTGKLWRIW